MRRVLAVSLVLLWAGPTAFAHRLDEYLQDTTFSLGRDRVAVEMRLTPGVGVLRTVLGTIDVDGDGVISEAEQRAYATWVLRDLSLSMDGEALPLRLRSATFPGIQHMKEGVGEILIECDAAVPAGGSDRRLVFENHHHRGISAYLVNCVVPDDSAIRIKAQDRNFDQSRYQLSFVLPISPWRSAMPMWLAVDGVVLVAWAVMFVRGRRRRAARSAEVGV